MPREIQPLITHNNIPTWDYFSCGFTFVSGFPLLGAFLRSYPPTLKISKHTSCAELEQMEES